MANEDEEKGTGIRKAKPFWQQLKQHARSAKNYGKHRRAAAKVHSDSNQRADSSAGGAKQEGNGTTTFHNAGALANSARAYYTATRKGASVALPNATLQQVQQRFAMSNAQYAATLTQAQNHYNAWLALSLAPEPSKPNKIPYEGVRLGEFIGHRIWFVEESGKLCSIAHKCLWEPNEIMSGDTEQLVFPGNLFNPPLYGGVYAFKNARALLNDSFDGDDFHYHLRNYGPVRVFCDTRDSVTVNGAVFGTVSMWGELYEHETGYRAEYAKIRSFTKAYGLTGLNALAARYNVPIESFAPERYEHEIPLNFARRYKREINSFLNVRQLNTLNLTLRDVSLQIIVTKISNGSLTLESSDTRTITLRKVQAQDGTFYAIAADVQSSRIIAEHEEEIIAMIAGY